MTTNSLSSEVEEPAPSVNYVIFAVSDNPDGAENIAGATLQNLIPQLHYGKVLFYSVIPFTDEATIQKQLRSVIEQNLADVILTVGGLGASYKELVPETFIRVIDSRTHLAASNGMSLACLDETSYNYLSRALCGITNRVLVENLPGNPDHIVCGLSKLSKTLIINLPGSEDRAVRCYKALAPAISFASVFLKEDIPKKVKKFRGSEHLKEDIPKKVKKFRGSEQNLSLIDSRSFKSKVPKNFEEEDRLEVGTVEESEAEVIIRKIIELNVKKEVETISVKEGCGRVLAEAVCQIKKEASQVQKRCTFDGYAIKLVDSNKDPTTKTVVGCVERDSDVCKLETVTRKTTYKVLDGAPLPPGANAVVSDDQCNDSFSHGKIKIITWPDPGYGVKDDEDDLIEFDRGEPLFSVDLVKIFLNGYKEVSVFKKPVIAILSTKVAKARGKKAANDDNSFQEEQIESKLSDQPPFEVILSIMLKKKNFEVIDVGFCPDEPSYLSEKLSTALSQADVTIVLADQTSDEVKFIRPVLQFDLGASIHFSSINIFPRNLTTFATLKWESVTKLVFALPGDLNSALIAFISLILPTMRRMEGQDDCSNDSYLAKVSSLPESSSIQHESNPTYLFASLTPGEGLDCSDLRPYDPHEIVYSDACLVCIPSESSTDLEVGSEVTAFPLDRFFM